MKRLRSAADWLLPAGPRRGLALGAALLVFLVSYFQANHEITFSFTLQTAAPDVVRVQYDVGNGYRSKNNIGIWTYSGPGAHQVRLPGGLRAVRLLLPAGTTRVAALSLEIGRRVVRYDAANRFAGWTAPTSTPAAAVVGPALQIQLAGEGALELRSLPVLERRAAVLAPLAWALLALLLTAVAAAAATRFGPRLLHAVGSEARLVVLVGGVFGVVLAGVTPPFQVPDENTHFVRVYGIAHGHLRPGSDGGTRLGAEGIRTLNEFMDLKAHAERKLHPSRVWAALTRAADAAQPAPFVDSGYPPFGYVGAIAGVLIARVLPGPTLVALYLARLGNLAVALAGLWLALLIAPGMRRTLALVALLPMNVAEMASASCDGVLVAACLTLFALILSVASGARRLDGKTVAALAGLSALIALCKANYLVLDLLLLAIPIARAGSWRRWSASLAAVAAAAWAAHAAWPLLLSWLPGAAHAAGSAVAGDSSFDRQLALVRADPLGFLAVWWRTLAEGHNLVTQLVGTFGWLETPLPQPVVAVYLAVLVLVAVTDSAPALSCRLRAAAAGSFALGSLSIALAMYLYYTAQTSFDHDIVLGMQGRYFLPLLPPALLLVQQSRLRWTQDDATASQWLAGFCSVGLAAAVWTIYDRFYVW